jgi:hypothetical protein
VAKHKRIQSSWPWIIAAGVLIVVLAVFITALVLDLLPRPETPTQTRPPGPATSADLYCLEFSRYSGEFFEDGTHARVTNVAAALIENRSPEFLDFATITYDVGGKTAQFVVTGLPPGGKTWVLETNRMAIEADVDFRFLDCTSTFRHDAVMSTEDLIVSTIGNTLTVTNATDYPLQNVCVYYKTMGDDGVYLGGISYMLAFDTLEPGQAVQRASGHFTKNSQIIRYSYQLA